MTDPTARSPSSLPRLPDGVAGLHKSCSSGDATAVPQLRTRSRRASAAPARLALRRALPQLRDGAALRSSGPARRPRPARSAGRSSRAAASHSAGRRSRAGARPDSRPSSPSCAATGRIELTTPGLSFDSSCDGHERRAARGRAVVLEPAPEELELLAEAELADRAIRDRALPVVAAAGRRFELVVPLLAQRRPARARHRPARARRPARLPRRGSWARRL